MNTQSKQNNLPTSIAGLGVLTLMLRLGLYRLGTDGKGLLVEGHLLDILSWAVTAFAAALVLLHLRKQAGSQNYGHNFTPSTAAAIGCFALAGGIAVTVLSNPVTYQKLELIRNICGLVSICALAFLGLHRWQGRKPFFLLHVLVCLYLTLHSISHYQIWSSSPQMQNWFFPMAASLCLTLFAYCQTAFDTDMGSRKMQLGTGLLAGFFCIAAIPTENSMLYLGGAVWALTNLVSLIPSPEKESHNETA